MFESPAKVYNIKFVMKLKIFFGFYYNFSSKLPYIILAKLYCIFCLLFLIIIRYSVFRQYFYLKYSRYFLIIEHISYFFVSFITGGEYMIKFLQYNAVIDSLPNARSTYKIHYKKVLFFVFVKVFLIKIFNNYLVDILDKGYVTLPCFSTSISRVVLEAAKFDINIILLLTYSRLIVLKNCLRTNGFVNDRLKKLPPKRYLEIYKTVVGGLKMTNIPFQIQVVFL